jgi:hypothetical protein
MTLREHELARSQRARRKHQKEIKRKKKPPQHALDAPLSMAHPNQILTFIEWCRLNRISERTGRRILASGKGPVVTQLSDWRVGISIAANDRWQASKARG